MRHSSLKLGVDQQQSVVVVDECGLDAPANRINVQWDSYPAISLVSRSSDYHAGRRNPERLKREVAGRYRFGIYF